MYSAQECVYDRNPAVSAVWPSDIDIFQIHTNSTTHCMFWNPAFEFRQCSTLYQLQDFCNNINKLRQELSDSMIFDLGKYNYDLSNVVKFNIWINQLRTQGNIKPWLVIDEGNGHLIAGTGDSRLKCLERLPHINTVCAIITTHISQQHRYQHLTPVTTFDEFAARCGANHGEQFLFRFTAHDAAYGIRWYEHANPLTRDTTPGDDFTLSALRGYLAHHPKVRFTPEWFDTLVDWHSYA